MKIINSYQKFTIHLNESKIIDKILESAGNEIDEKAFQKIRYAITQILARYPFFAHLILSMKIKQLNTPQNPTMATDGNAIYYNSDFVNNVLTQYDSQGKADVKEVLFVLCHEVLHCSMFHFLRKQKNPMVWNMAADYAINYILDEMFKSEGSNSMGRAPKGILLDKKYENWPAEAIYDYLMKNAKQMPKDFNNIGGVMEPQEGGGGTDVYEGESEDGDEKDGEGSGEGKEDKEGKPCDKCDGSGEGEDGEPCDKCNGTGKEGKDGKPSDKEGKDGKDSGKFKAEDKKDIKDPDKLKEKWDKMNKEAVSKHQGSGSLGIDRYVRGLLKPQINWKNVLKRFIMTAMSNKIKYQIPYRRFIHSGTYLPGIKKDTDAYNNAVIIVDTSGSINDKILRIFCSEIQALYSLVNILEFHVISCDDEITKVESFKDVRKLKISKFPGGGGTDFRPPFKWIYEKLVKKSKDPSFVIFFTDGFGPFPTPDKVPYKNNVLWVIMDDPDDHIKIPFGKKLNIKTSDFNRD